MSVDTMIQSQAKPQLPSYGRAQVESSMRRNLRLVLIAWIFGSFWQWTISGAAMTRFALGVGTPDWAFGLLAMLPPLAGTLQLPASILLERFGRRKAVFMISQTLARFTWVIIAAIPWILPQAQNLWWPLMMVAVLISWSGAHLATPAWMNWMAEVVPVSVRGRYFGRRNRLGQLVGIVVTIAIGFLLDAADHLGAVTGLDSHRLMLMTTSVIIALAGLVGVLDIQCFSRVPDTRPPPAPRTINWSLFFTRPLQDRSFRYFLGFNFLLWMGIGSLTQYLWLYLFDVINVSNQAANMMLVALPLAGFALTFPLWGRLIDRVGCRPVLLICSLLSALGPLGWIAIQPGLIWPGYIVVFATILIWPGVEIAAFNLLLGIAGSGHGSSAFVACYALAVGLGGIASGVLSSLMVAYFGDFHYHIPALGLQLTYHSLIMLVSFAVRLLAVPLALKIHEPRAHHTEAVIKYMSTTLHSNVRTFILQPNKLVNQMIHRAGRGPGR